MDTSLATKDSDKQSSQSTKDDIVNTKPALKEEPVPVSSQVKADEKDGNLDNEDPDFEKLDDDDDDDEFEYRPRAPPKRPAVGGSSKK